MSHFRVLTRLNHLHHQIEIKCYDSSIRYLGVCAGLCGHVVEPLGQVDVLPHAVSQLVHVAEVEHGLRVVLLVGGDPVVQRRCLEVPLRPPTVVVIVTQSDARRGISLGRRSKRKES